MLLSGQRPHLFCFFAVFPLLSPLPRSIEPLPAHLLITGKSLAADP
jgi:hypothetical protein